MGYVLTFIAGLFIGLVLTCCVVAYKDTRNE